MRVQCFLCEHHSGANCMKKKTGGKPVKVHPKKRRTCSLYKEDPMKVLAQFRKNEKHKANLKRQQMKQAQIVKAIQELREAQAKELKSNSNEGENDKR